MKDRSHSVPTTAATTSLAIRIKIAGQPSNLPQSASVAPESRPINSGSEDCQMVRSSAQSLANLASSSTLLLFTPAVTPAGKATNKTGENIDPFEPLGRALSRYHRRIRHVPYVPKIGFTETHDAFLSQADAVIVVICEPEQAKHECVGNQGDFADATHEALDNASFGGQFPLVLIRCGDSNGTFWPDLMQFDNVMKCSTYDPEMAKQIARKLFDGRK